MKPNALESSINYRAVSIAALMLLVVFAIAGCEKSTTTATEEQTATATKK